jgi:hypothetical protein
MHSAELGLHGLELGWVRAVRVTEQTCTEIKAAAQTYGWASVSMRRTSST